MKNLNRTIEKVTMPKLSLVTSVNRQFLYSLCAALFLLTCSLSTKAQSGLDSTHTYVLPTFGFSGSNITFLEDSQCTSCSPFTNNYGSSLHSGSDKWIQINVADDGYLTIQGGTANFDSVFYLFDSNWNLITSADDGYGSGGTGTGGVLYQYMQPQIQYYATAGTYYLIVDGTDKVGLATSGTVDVEFFLDH